MGVLGERSWCFCSGGARSERVKAGIFSGKGPAMAWVPGGGTGFLIHRSLLLTTHVGLPSVAAAEGTEIQIHQGRVSARLVPHRFFITSTVLDLTIVGLDTLETDSSSQAQQPHYLKTSCSPSLELGNMVYLLGYTDKKELMVGEGKVVVATDNLIKFSTDGITWCPGSAGFDVHGNLAFMVCDPMKLASSPTAKSSSASSSSSNSGKKDLPMQFGIPIPIICDWLYQHWEGSLDELSKPKLPIIRLMSTGQKSDHSCASFTMRWVFKSNEGENDDMPSSSQIISRQQQLALICSTNLNAGNGQNPLVDLQSAHEQGIPAPEIYETRKMTSGPLQKNENSPIQLLDINFPPRALRSVLPLPVRQLLTETNENDAEEPVTVKRLREVEVSKEMRPTNPEEYAEVTVPCPAQGDCHSEVQSSSSPLEVSVLPNEGNDGFSSEGETMYSAETMESRNFPSPKRDRLQQLGRSQSCMSYNRWGSAQRNPAVGRASQQQHSLMPVRKTHSQTATMSQKSHDYHSPTVSSIMKKRNGSEQQRSARPRQSVAQVSPRWMF